MAALEHRKFAIERREHEEIPPLSSLHPIAPLPSVAENAQRIQQLQDNIHWLTQIVQHQGNVIQHLGAGLHHSSQLAPNRHALFSVGTQRKRGRDCEIEQNDRNVRRRIGDAPESFFPSRIQRRRAETRLALNCHASMSSVEGNERYAGGGTHKYRFRPYVLIV